MYSIDFHFQLNVVCLPDFPYTNFEIKTKRYIKHIPYFRLTRDLFIGASSYFDYMDGIELYQAPPLIQLLQSTRKQPRCAAELHKKLNQSYNTTDCFRQLPIELIELLAGYISTRDYLNSRLASRSMGMLFHKQGFWKKKN